MIEQALDTIDTTASNGMGMVNDEMRVKNDRAAKTLRVASVNVNGIRAAYRKDMATWLAGRDVDISAAGGSCPR